MKTALMFLWAAVLLIAPLPAAAQSQAPKGAPPALAPAAPSGEDSFEWVDALFGGDTGESFAEAADDDGAPPSGPPHEMSWTDGNPHMHRMMAGGPRGRSMMMRHGLAMRFAALDLTDQQRDKLRDIHEQAARKSVQRRADMQLARMDLQKLMRADTPSSSAINTQIDRITRLQSDGMKAHYDAFMQARGVLTPEQLKQLRSGLGPRKMKLMDGEAPPKR
jgi:Spy/CpxP family protein refolding chaperone